MRDLGATEHATALTTTAPDAACNTARLRWTVFHTRNALVALAVAIFLWLGQFATATQKRENVLQATTVRADRFELIGPSGKTAALLRTNEDGTPSLSFLNEKGSVSLDLGISLGGQPALRMYDARGLAKLR